MKNKNYYLLFAVLSIVYLLAIFSLNVCEVSLPHTDVFDYKFYGLLVQGLAFSLNRMISISTLRSICSVIIVGGILFSVGYSYAQGKKIHIVAKISAGVCIVFSVLGFIDFYTQVTDLSEQLGKYSKYLEFSVTPTIFYFIVVFLSILIIGYDFFYEKFGLDSKLPNLNVESARKKNNEISLEDYFNLLQKGAITQEEYDAKKKEILG